jgi:hypothetical protein
LPLAVRCESIAKGNLSAAGASATSATAAGATTAGATSAAGATTGAGADENGDVISSAISENNAFTPAKINMPAKAASSIKPIIVNISTFLSVYVCVINKIIYIHNTSVNHC